MIKVINESSINNLSVKEAKQYKSPAAAVRDWASWIWRKLKVDYRDPRDLLRGAKPRDKNPTEENLVSLSIDYITNSVYSNPKAAKEYDHRFITEEVIEPRYIKAVYSDGKVLEFNDRTLGARPNPKDFPFSLFPKITTPEDFKNLLGNSVTIIKDYHAEVAYPNINCKVIIIFDGERLSVSYQEMSSNDHDAYSDSLSSLLSKINNNKASSLDELKELRDIIDRAIAFRSKE